MKLPNDNYCTVDLKYAHPRLGNLHVDRFVRTLDECQLIERTKEIKWQSIILPVIETLVITKNELPELLSKIAHYTFIVGDPNE